MRTFHIGGAASRTAAASTVETKSAGTANFAGAMRYVKNAAGDKIVIARSAEVVISDGNRERERHKVPYGAKPCLLKTARRSRLARCSPSGTRLRAQSLPSSRAASVSRMFRKASRSPSRPMT